MVDNLLHIFMKIQAIIPKITNSICYSRRNVEMKCSGLLEKLHQTVAKTVEAEWEDSKILVGGAAVPTDWVKPLLPDGLNHCSKTIVLFFDGSMAPAAQYMSTRAFEYSFAWDLTLQRMNLYFTWDLPSLSLDVPNFRRDFKSKLAIVSTAVYRGVDFGREGSPDTVTNFVLVTDSNVFVTSYCIRDEDACIMQAFDSSAENSRGYKFFSEHQLRVAEAKAEELRLPWPWMAGTWPVVCERDEPDVDVYVMESSSSAELVLAAPFNTCTPWADDIHLPGHLTHADCLRASLNFIGGHIFSVDSL